LLPRKFQLGLVDEACTLYLLYEIKRLENLDDLSDTEEEDVECSEDIDSNDGS